MSDFLDCKDAEPQRVVLLDERTEGGSRHLSAFYAESGSLLISGQDIGRQVTATLQHAEYEWSYSIEPPALAKLAGALGVRENLLGAIELWFQRASAPNFKAFLVANEIQHEFWCRIGD